jgi:hypothetical protein
MMRPSQQDRPDVAAEREAFRRMQPSLDVSRLVFVDESGIWQGMRTAYGYARGGQRCSEAAPFRVGRRLGLIGWIGQRGAGVVPVEGTVTADVFERFVEHYLVPELRPGDIVVWDNARVHSEQAFRLVEQAGATVLPQPRYSPEMNAAEPMWSKVKGFIKRMRADTAEALETALAAAMATLTREDVWSWMRHCGYTHQPT